MTAKALGLYTQLFLFSQFFFFIHLKLLQLNFRTPSHSYESISLRFKLLRKRTAPRSLFCCDKSSRLCFQSDSITHNIICYACSDGMGRTGTFITIFSQLERIKTESICDVFQCIKAMRLQRPCMVENAVRTLTQML